MVKYNTYIYRDTTVILESASDNFVVFDKVYYFCNYLLYSM